MNFYRQNVAKNAFDFMCVSGAVKVKLYPAHFLENIRLAKAAIKCVKL